MEAKVGDWALCDVENHHPRRYTKNRPYKIDKITTVPTSNIQIFCGLDNSGEENGLSEIAFSRILATEEKHLAELLYK